MSKFCDRKCVLNCRRNKLLAQYEIWIHLLNREVIKVFLVMIDFLLDMDLTVDMEASVDMEG